MTNMKLNQSEYRNTIVIGGGAAGLYFGARIGQEATSSQIGSRHTLVLEKTNKLGTKLLMAGAGQCNITHGGHIKDFLDCYGEKGKAIRTVLYRHSNQEVCAFFESLGVPLVERDDKKIFPASMNSYDIRDALVSCAKHHGVEFETESAVVEIQSLIDGVDETSTIAKASVPRYRVVTSKGRTLETSNLVIATGGASYPTTGSDGSLYTILERDLGIIPIPLAPALVPAYTENYPFGELSGISIRNVSMKIYEPRSSNVKAKAKKKNELLVSGDLLFTHKNLSGPVIINHSRYLKPGTVVEINYLSDTKEEDVLQKMKKEFSANQHTIEHWITDHFGLPKRFSQILVGLAEIEGRKVSTLSGKELNRLATFLCRHRMVISGLGSYKEAMVTSGGIDLASITLKTMESKTHPGLYFIGEVVDVDGDTGGYNLQFAFASADAAVQSILEK